MIDKIIELCLKNRFLVIAAFCLLIIWGFFSMKGTPVDAIPDIGELQVIVYADWPGRSPRDVEDLGAPRPVGARPLQRLAEHVALPSHRRSSARTA